MLLQLMFDAFTIVVDLPRLIDVALVLPTDNNVPVVSIKGVLMELLNVFVEANVLA